MLAHVSILINGRWGYKTNKNTIHMKIIVFFVSSVVIALGLCSWTFYGYNAVGSTSFAHPHGWVCDKCDGTGHSKVLKCRKCLGEGFVPASAKCDSYGCENGKVLDKYGKPHPCGKCSGTGIVKYKKSCPTCGGWGTADCDKCHGTGEVLQN